MATVNFIRNAKQSRGALGGVKQYVEQKKKTLDQLTGQHLVSGQNCNPQFADREFLATRDMHHKDSPRYFYHYTQSFHPGEPITGELAHKIAKEFAARAWPESEVLIATHIDAEHIHSHFVVNAVCYSTGKMLRQSPNTLQRLRQISDELCQAHGLSVLPSGPKKQQQGMSAREYRSAVKGESWKFRLMNTIDQCMRHAHNREEFITLMESEGYKVRWEKNRSNITYTTLSGWQCRDRKLFGDKYLKENMEYEFRIREEIIYGRAHEEEPSSADGTDCTDGERISSTGDAGSAQHHDPMSDAGGAGQVGMPDAVSGAEQFQSGRVSETADRDARMAAHQNTGGRTDESGDEVVLDSRTGWETEREIFLSAQHQTAQAAAATPGRSDISSPPDVAGGVASALVGFGRRLEQSQFAAPVTDSTTMRHHADRKALRKEKKKKIALGQKEDDHEEDHIWQQTM